MWRGKRASDCPQTFENVVNRRFTFSYARGERAWKQLASFLAASAIGMAVNYATSLSLLRGPFRDLPLAPQLSAVVGVAAGLIFNFVGNRYVVFRRRFVREASPRTDL